jgi:DNA-directed RNA polymerase specialized sigma24 family protein
VNQLDRDQAPEGPARCRGFVTELVVRCGRGDEAALGRLLDLFYAPVLADAARRGHPRPDDAAVSEAFVRLWSAAPTFSPGAQCTVEWAMAHLTAWAVDEPHVLVAS